MGTLRRGETWTALVKNLRANGEQHYWVRANVAPIRHGSQVVGYLSVRTRPTDYEIDAAEELYRAFREGRAQRKYAFHKGLVVRKGFMGWASRLCQTLPVRWCLRLSLGTAALATLAPALWADLPALAFAPPLVAITLAGIFLEARIAKPLAMLLERAGAVAAGHVEPHVHIQRLDEIGMAAQEMSTTLDHSAAITVTAHELASDASAAVSLGGEAMAQVVQTMQNIARSNQRIRRIRRILRIPRSLRNRMGSGRTGAG